MLTRCRIQQELNTLYKEAFNYVKNNENLSEASKLITKMLKHDPKSHKIYALRGTIFKLQGKSINRKKKNNVKKDVLSSAL